MKFSFQFSSILLSLILLSSACKKETPTAGEITAKKLSADIKAHGMALEHVLAKSFYDRSVIYEGISYAIDSDGFIIIKNFTSQSTFNLGELKSYELSGNQLVLYF